MEMYDSEAEDGPIALGHVQQQPVRLLAGQDVCEAQDVAGLRPRQARQHASLAPKGPHLPAQACAALCESSFHAVWHIQHIEASALLKPGLGCASEPGTQGASLELQTWTLARKLARLPRPQPEEGEVWRVDSCTR